MPVAHRQILRDLPLGFQPLHGNGFFADLVDQLQFTRLRAGDDPAVGQGADHIGRQMPAFGDHIKEIPERVLDGAIKHRLGLGACRLERAGLRLQRRRLHLFQLDADRLHQPRYIRPLRQNANRARQRRAAGDDMVGPQRHHVAGGGANRGNIGDRRLASRQLAHCLIDSLAADAGPTGAGDIDDHALDLIAAADAVKQVQQLAISGDEAIDADPRDLRAALAGQVAEGACGGQSGDAAANQRHDRKAAPEPEFTLQGAAVDNQIGIERHGTLHWRRGVTGGRVVHKRM